MNWNVVYQDIELSINVQDWFKQLNKDIRDTTPLNWNDIPSVIKKLLKWADNAHKEVYIPIGFAFEKIVKDKFEGCKYNNYMDYNLATDFIWNNMGFSVKLSSKGVKSDFKKNKEKIDKCIKRYKLTNFYYITPSNVYRYKFGYLSQPIKKCFLNL